MFNHKNFLKASWEIDGRECSSLYVILLFFTTRITVPSLNASAPQACRGSHRELSGALRCALTVQGTQSRHLRDMTGTTSSRKFSYDIGLHDIPFNNAAWFWAIAVMKTRAPGKNPGRTENESGRILIPRFEKLCSTQQAHIYHYNLF